MLSAFGDESSDSNKARVFAVGGLLGSDEQWGSLRSEWKKRIGSTVFHAADCESGFGDYRGVPEEERRRLHRQLTSVLATSRVFGWGRVIDLIATGETSFSVAIREMPDLPYYDCFLWTTIKLCDLASHFIPADRVEFTFDQHRDTQYNAALLYDWLSAHRPQAAAKISYATRRDYGIQAADLWARELMKRCDGLLFNPSGIPRLQWQTLKAAGRFSGKFLKAGYWKTLLTQDAEAMKKAGFSNAAYNAWRTERKIIDNPSNRLIYATSLDASTLKQVKNNPGDVVAL